MINSDIISFMDTYQVIRLLKARKVGIIPTDTIYGIVGLALNPKTVEEIYNLRKRAKDKPMIILISDLSDLEKFDVKVSKQTEEILKRLWPNPVSIVLPCPNEKFTYLHRGGKTLAFRMPKDKWLRDLLKEVGPLVAPSANIEGEPVAETVEGAKKYFGGKVDFYLDKGKIPPSPSTLIEIKDSEIKVLRQGNFNI